jgi:hypothetical protein
LYDADGGVDAGDWAQAGDADAAHGRVSASAEGGGVGVD